MCRWFQLASSEQNKVTSLQMKMFKYSEHDKLFISNKGMNDGDFSVPEREWQ